jgi:hypothetical protein
MFGWRRKPQLDAQRLLGGWSLVESEGSDVVGDGVLMTFDPDGRLTYAVEENGKQQIMNLVWQVDGDEIVSNQPSAPREERTKASFDDRGRLTLVGSDGNRTVFEKIC